MQARLSVDELEDMTRRDPTAAYEGAGLLLTPDHRPDDELLAQRLLLVRADVEARRGQTEASGRRIRDVRAWAVQHDSRFLQARSHRLLSGLFLRLGDSALALEHAVTSVDLLDRDERLAIRADHLLGLATALSACSSFDDARRRFEEATRLAEAAGDVELRLVALNNLAYTEYRAGCGAEAVAAAEHLLAIAAAHGVSLGYEELDTVACAYLLGGRLDEAEQTLLALHDDGPVDRAADYDGVVVGLLTLVRVQRLRGAATTAQLTLDRCRRLCAERDLPALDVPAQREQAELFAAAGRYRDAYEVFTAFHEASQALDSADREARARTLQAIFEADEARRDSERFRELAELDPLTGLRNRRFVDARLAALLVSVADLRTPLTVALLDLDHFKDVNDTRSHDVGDEVLCRVARLLEQSLAEVPDGVAARMGGEEFLLILPGTDADAAGRLLEDVRRVVAAYDWYDLTAGVPVTVSIGSATAPRDGAERSVLLRGSDRNLYVAKREGRNRVVSTAPNAT